MMSSARKSKVVLSRKNCVTPISRSWRSSSASPGIYAQELEIGCSILDMRRAHAMSETALQRAPLVDAEIVRGFFSQKIDDFREGVRRRLVHRLRRWGIEILWMKMSEDASGISATGAMRSTAPVAIALRGIPSKSASCGS